MSFSYSSPACTITASTAVVNDVVILPGKKQHCAALFVDLSNAFDTVDHNALLNKLLPRYMIRVNHKDQF